MRVRAEFESLYERPYRCAAPGGGVRERLLQVLGGEGSGWPAGPVAGLLCTADLQGVDRDSSRLLGQVLADEWPESILDPSKIGVILAGDLYASETADRMGATGDVSGVWRHFARRFRWVAGVAGNHDLVGSPGDLEKEPGIHFLDGNLVELDGLRLAGISGIIGKAGRRWRRSPDAYYHLIQELLAQKPDILILHETPLGPAADLRGNEELARRLLSDRETLVVCGHCYWPRPVAELAGRVQVLNVDSRAVLLRRPGMPHATKP